MCMECVHGAAALAAAGAPLGWGLWRWASAHKPSGEQVVIWLARGFLFSLAIGMMAAGFHYEYPFIGAVGFAFFVAGAILVRLDVSYNNPKQPRTSPLG